MNRQDAKAAKGGANLTTETPRHQGTSEFFRGEVAVIFPAAAAAVEGVLGVFVPWWLAVLGGPGALAVGSH
jgi:hypothetical protein